MPGPQTVFIRKIPDSFTQALRENAVPLNVTTARSQHTVFVETLERIGLTVVCLEADNRFPDCVFIEDTALIIGNSALITRPGADSRRGECVAVRRVLDKHFQIVELPTGAFLDGGDICVTEDRLFVGQSRRTNAAALDFLRVLFGDYHIIGVRVPGTTLHLKSICSYLGDGKLLLCDFCDQIPEFSLFERLLVPRDEWHAANCRRFDSDVILAANAPRTFEMLDNLGHRLHTVNLSELNKADGAISCLSLSSYHGTYF